MPKRKERLKWPNHLHGIPFYGSEFARRGFILSSQGETPASYSHFKWVMNMKKVADSNRCEIKYDLLFEKMMNGLAICEIILDKNGAPYDYLFLAVNPAYETITGIKACDIVGKTVREVFQSIESYWIEAYGRVALTGESVRFEKYSFELGKCLEVVAFPTQKGRFATILADITLKNDYLKQVKNKNNLLLAINQILREAIFCNTEEEVAEKCLSVAESLTGSHFGFIGTVNGSGRFDTIALSDPGWDKCRMPRAKAFKLTKNMKLRGIWSSVVNQGQSLIVNHPASHPDRVGIPEGHPPITAFLGVPLRKGDETVGMIGLANKQSGYTQHDMENIENLAAAFRDALERKRDEAETRNQRDQLKKKTRELVEAYKELRMLDKLKDTFLSSVSHEMRTPLTSIRSFSEILRAYTDLPEEDRVEFVKIINVESERLTQLIDDVLDFSHIEGKKMDWRDELLCMKDVIKDAATLQKPLLEEKSLRLVLDIPSDVMNVYVDRDKIQQVITNLLRNAIKFSHEGCEIIIRAEGFEGRRFREPLRWIKVSISDRGIGISRKDLGIIFEKFHQIVADTLTDKPKGAGLGLAIAREIVDHYGGNIGVSSQEGKGSTFYFTLPTTMPASGLVNGACKPNGQKSSQKKFIFVVDDDSAIRESIRMLLEDKGYPVHIASDGKEALEQLKGRISPDLVILDVVMKCINGEEVLHWIRENPRTSHIPVIVLSAFPLSEEQQKLFAEKDAEYINKSEGLMSLCKRVESIIPPATP